MIKMAKLSSVSSFIRGITFKPSDLVEFGSQNSVACMRTKNVQVILDESDIISVPDSLVKRRQLLLQEGDILISVANSWNLVGKCCYVPKLGYEATAGGFIAILRPNHNRVEKRFLYHWLSSPNIQKSVRLCGRQTTNISNIDRERFLDLEIPLPPLDEQKRIAAILDKADAIRRKRQQAMELADEFLRAVFLDMFGDPVTNPKGWDEVEFNSLLINGFRNGQSPSTTGGYSGRVYILSAITGPRFDVQAHREAMFDRKINQYYPETNDFLICRGNGNIKLVGKGKFTPRQDVPIAFPDTMIAASVDTNLIIPEFLEALWDTPYIRNQIESSSRTTSGIHKVNQKMLADLKLILPPITQQEKFATIVEKSTIARNAMSFFQENDLYLSLQHKAFQGML